MSDRQEQPRRGRGRPPVDGERATRRLYIRVTLRQRAEIDRVARENRQTVTQMLREAVNEYVADYAERGGPFVSAHKSAAASS